MPLRAEPTVTQSVAERKILQNLSKIKQITAQRIVRFCLDFVGFLAEGDPKPTPKVRAILFRRNVILGLFRMALTPVPTASITHSAVIYRGKVTAERPLDDVGKGVSNVWNECK